MANLMFDTQLRRSDYDTMNAVIDRQTKVFYASATLTHMVALSYLTYMFRYRSLSKPQVLLVGTAYYLGFNPVNNTLYKWQVDSRVIRTAKALGHGRFVQPNGDLRPRGLKY